MDKIIVEQLSSNPQSTLYSSNAKGTSNFAGGPTWLNESFTGGTEAIVTPYGTLTSLPSHSGVVPAKLTTSLYHLGEVAPNIIKNLELQAYGKFGSSGKFGEDNSVNIATLNANFEVNEDFDMDAFLRDVQSVVNTTRHLPK